jgi:hypothetical protein
MTIVQFTSQSVMYNKRNPNKPLCVGGVHSQNQTEQVQDITDLLSTSTARFKLVVGHHPIRSYASHCNFNEVSALRSLDFIIVIFPCIIAKLFCRSSQS